LRTVEALAQIFADVSGEIIAGVEGWSEHQWIRPYEVHGETQDPAHLALHIARRSRYTIAFARGETTAPTPPPQPDELEPESVLKSLHKARQVTLSFIEELDEEAAQQLSTSEIDGEADVFMASCGVIGHWTNHLEAVREISRG
jgi:hypothetical protein